jgi:hypothetical protein
MEARFNELLHYNGEPPGPICAEIENKRVVAFRVEDGRVGLGETCDGAFSIWLEPAEFDALLAELNGLKQQL